VHNANIRKVFWREFRGELVLLFLAVMQSQYSLGYLLVLV
jgi:hypothetical protein